MTCAPSGLLPTSRSEGQASRRSPSGIDEFTDAVIRAEGMDPVHIDGDLRRRMREIIEAGAGRIL